MPADRTAEIANVLAILRADEARWAAKVEDVTATATNRLREVRETIAALESFAPVGADNEDNATA
jgi:hypothetical protein